MASLFKRYRFVPIGIILLFFFYFNLCLAQTLAPSSKTPSVLPVSSDIVSQFDTMPLSSGMISHLLPTIPNLQFGFQYFFGDRIRSGQINADYLLPVNIGDNAVVFGEARGNYWNFGKKPTGGASNRVDLSLGGGYRKILADKLLVGVNGFYDTSKLFNNWYSSGSVGLEMAANVGTSDAFDLNANWYGAIFSSADIINAFRNKGGSYDIEAGYSHALFNSQYDLRLKFAGYQFDTGKNVYGYRTGADLTTKNGMFMLRYEYGNDIINGAWNNVGAFVNIGFQVENIIKGESPFTMPEPIFKSPRNLNRMLAQTVKRDWNQSYAPGRAALAAASVGSGPGPTPGPTECGTTTEQAITISLGSFTEHQLAEPYVKVSDLTSTGCATVTFTCTGPGGNNNLLIQIITTSGANYDFTIPAGVFFNGEEGTYSFTSVSDFQELLRTQDPWGTQYVEKIVLRIVKNYSGGSTATTTTNPVVCFNRTCN